jgi:CRP-like cAMP-binding protein
MTNPAPSSNPFVRKIEGFVSLTDEERTALAEASASPRMVKAGTMLVEEGQSPRGVHLILEGMAYRYKLRANGRRQITAYLVPGDLGCPSSDDLGHSAVFRSGGSGPSGVRG